MFPPPTHRWHRSRRQSRHRRRWYTEIKLNIQCRNPMGCSPWQPIRDWGWKRAKASIHGCRCSSHPVQMFHRSVARIHVVVRLHSDGINGIDCAPYSPPRGWWARVGVRQHPTSHSIKGRKTSLLCLVLVVGLGRGFCMGEICCAADSIWLLETHYADKVRRRRWRFKEGNAYTRRRCRRRRWCRIRACKNIDLSRNYYTERAVLYIIE